MSGAQCSFGVEGSVGVEGALECLLLGLAEVGLQVLIVQTLGQEVELLGRLVEISLKRPYTHRCTSSPSAAHAVGLSSLALHFMNS